MTCRGQDGDVLDILVQTKRDKTAATKFFRKLLKGLRYIPRVIVTDKLKSYSAARAEVVPSVEHVQQKYQNNRAENSHQPTRSAASDLPTSTDSLNVPSGFRFTYRLSVPVLSTRRESEHRSTTCLKVKRGPSKDLALSSFRRSPS